jgi:Icc-related predicted phosphoesterase
MIRIAAVGDIHLGVQDAGRCRPAYESVADHADLLLLAGDLTKLGTHEEAGVVAEEFGGLPVPVVAVLGNHDHHSDAADDVTQVLSDAGITVLEGTAAEFTIRGQTVGVAGTKGFGGGFAGKCASNFGEAYMKDFVGRTVSYAAALGDALAGLRSDHRIALTHYAPTAETLHGEPPEIYAFLGSYLLAEAIDGAGAELALHGHAHYGSEQGLTPGGVRVRNVARPVIGAPYAVYALPDAGARESSASRRAEEPQAAYRAVSH